MSITSLTRTPDGWSTGWTEGTRNRFHTFTLFTVITGESLCNMPELAELTSHWSGQGREACQSYISEDGSVLGFYVNVGCISIKFKEKLAKHSKELYDAFQTMKETKEMTNYTVAMDEKAITTARNQLCEAIKARFGEFIEIVPFASDGVFMSQTLIGTLVTHIPNYVMNEIARITPHVEPYVTRYGFLKMSTSLESSELSEAVYHSPILSKKYIITFGHPENGHLSGFIIVKPR